jgi:hypothetical protein
VADGEIRDGEGYEDSRRGVKVIVPRSIIEKGVQVVEEPDDVGEVDPAGAV